jgi:homoserine kinase
MRFTVSVPASSANLGSGFDNVAIALDLPMTLDVSPTDGRVVRVVEGPDLFGGENLVESGIRAIAEAVGRAVPGCQIRVASEIPVARGLGSSASALVGGLVAGNYLLGQVCSDEELLEIATEIEGHGDNVSASLFGGITLAVRCGSSVICRKLEVAGPLQTAVFVPDALGLTVDARAVVPGSIPRADAIANLGRSALLVYALTCGEFELLGEAMRDFLHQPFRAHLFPHVAPMVDCAVSSGAYGACLSGAGPSVLALVAPERATDVRAAFDAIACSLGVTGRAVVLDVAWAGSAVEDSVAQQV